MPCHRHEQQSYHANRCLLSIITNNHVNFPNVKTFFANTGRNKNIVDALFKSLDYLLKPFIDVCVTQYELLYLKLILLCNPLSAVFVRSLSNEASRTD